MTYYLRFMEFMTKYKFLFRGKWNGGGIEYMCLSLMLNLVCTNYKCTDDCSFVVVNFTCYKVEIRYFQLSDM